MTLTDEQRSAILDEIILATTPAKRQAYQFTRREYQEQRGITQAQARTLLQNAVKAGQLLKARLLVQGKWCDVFWRPQDEPEDDRESQASRES